MVEIAKVGSPFGLLGELKLYILSDSVKSALSYKPWYIRVFKAQKWSILTKESVVSLGDKLLIHFNGIDTREKARSFTNSFIGVPRSILKSTKDNVFYWFDLIGLKVINKYGDDFGNVDRVFNNGSNDILCCKKNQKEFLIPFVKQYITTVDRAKKQVIVDWQYNY